MDQVHRQERETQGGTHADARMCLLSPKVVCLPHQQGCPRDPLGEPEIRGRSQVGYPTATLLTANLPWRTITGMEIPIRALIFMAAPPGGESLLSVGALTPEGILVKRRWDLYSPSGK